MKIGNLEIILHRKRLTMQADSSLVTRHSSLPPADVRVALRVPDTSPIWRAVLQTIDEAEAESLDSARDAVADERLCVNSLGAADGARLVRSKLLALREEALAASPQTLNAQRSTLNAQ